MYGLVNKALEDLVCTRFGADAWETIKQRAGVEVDVFLSMEAYPDDITYKLVGAASEILQLSPEEMLHTFGEYWVLYTAREGYGAMLQMAGETLPVFLQNLNDLHTRVGLIFPSLRPPSFRCTDIQEDSLRLHYYSTRTGLAPLVIGLVHGLAIMFKTEIQMTQTASRGQGADHDEFLVTFQGR
jgi:hypothetical protein